jgi:hypothetical protein
MFIGGDYIFETKEISAELRCIESKIIEKGSRADVNMIPFLGEAGCRTKISCTGTTSPINQQGRTPFICTL